MARSRAQQAAIAISMKKAGKKPKTLKKAKEGTSVKKGCPPNCNREQDLKEVTIQGKKKTLGDKIRKGIDNVVRKTYPFNIPYDTTVKAMKKVDDTVESVGRGYTKLKNKVKKHLGVHKAGGATKSVPKGYHIMPNGKLMKNSAHKKKK